ncbi:MAG: helix-turn-helix transcriptional regulator [bacterium]|nr:helix-turn-helix transcriptional regulator [bacterium]
MNSEFLLNENKKLPVYVVDSEISIQKPCDRRNGGSFPAQLTLCLEGEGTFIDADNKKHNLERGDIFIIRADAPHYYYPVSTCWKTFTIQFSGNEINNIMDYAGLNDTSVICPRNVQFFEKLYTYMYYIHKVLYDVKQEQYKHIITSPIIYDLLFRLGKLYNTKHSFPEFDSKAEKLAPAIKRMFNDFGENLSPDILAEETGLSKLSFERLFKEVVHISPMMFLRNIRMFYAQHELLRNKAISIEQLARNAGFTNTSYFCKLFKEKFGETPKVYQETHQLEELVGISSILGL